MLVHKHVEVLAVRMPGEGASKTSADDRGRCPGCRASRGKRACRAAPGPAEGAGNARVPVFRCWPGAGARRGMRLGEIARLRHPSQGPAFRKDWATPGCAGLAPLVARAQHRPAAASADFGPGGRPASCKGRSWPGPAVPVHFGSRECGPGGSRTAPRETGISGSAPRGGRVLPGAGFDGGGEVPPGGRGEGQYGAGPVFGVADGDQGAGVTDLNAVTAVGAGVG